GQVGLYDWPTEGSWQSSRREKTERDLSLKLRGEFEVDERGRIRLGACFGPKEIKVASDRDASSELDLKRFQPRVLHLYPSTILAVLNDCVMHLQLPLGCYDVIGAVTFVKQISEDPKFPIIIGVINQSGLRKHTFQAEMICEEPDDTAARGNDWI